jgi:hypothetical protein
MPNNRAAASPKRAPCRFEELMGGQLTEDNRKVQRMRRYRRPGRTLPRWQWRGTSGGTPRAEKRGPTRILFLKSRMSPFLRPLTMEFANPI